MFSQAVAQSAGNEKYPSYSDTTSIPGLHFSLDGPHKIDGDLLVISEHTQLRFYRNENDDPHPGNISYRLDNANEVDYHQPFTITGDGTHVISVRQPLNDRGDLRAHTFQVLVDNTPPSVVVSLVYKSIVLKQFHQPEKEGQIGRGPLSCPRGSELRVTTNDYPAGLKTLFLKEGKASYPILQGITKLNSRGEHTYVIVASDFVGNTVETGAIVLQITEP